MYLKTMMHHPFSAYDYIHTSTPHVMFVFPIHLPFRMNSQYYPPQLRSFQSSHSGLFE